MDLHRFDTMISGGFSPLTCSADQDFCFGAKPTPLPPQYEYGVELPHYSGSFAYSLNNDDLGVDSLGLFDSINIENAVTSVSLGGENWETEVSAENLYNPTESIKAAQYVGFSLSESPTRSPASFFADHEVHNSSGDALEKSLDQEQDSSCFSAGLDTDENDTLFDTIYAEFIQLNTQSGFEGDSPSSGYISEYSPHSDHSYSSWSSEIEKACNVSDTCPDSPPEHQFDDDHFSTRSTEDHNLATLKSKDDDLVSAKRSSKRSARTKEDRYERKKEQNKVAALRYRQKKKQEEKEIVSLLKAEVNRKEQLEEDYSNVNRELRCLKKLMLEIFLQKGLITKEHLT